MYSLLYIKAIKSVYYMFYFVYIYIYRNDPDLVQAFLKKWWVESYFKDKKSNQIISHEKLWFKYHKPEFHTRAKATCLNGVHMVLQWLPVINVYKNKIKHIILFCPLVLFCFRHCVVCSSSIYGLWLPLWYLQTFLP
jgi:hypothetical protein